MFVDDVSTSELLSAYLNGDVTPAERSAVEKYLSGDLAARSQLHELKQLNVLLQAGDRQARAELLERLRRAVLNIVQLRQLEAAVAAGVAEEQNSQERALVEEHLRVNPAAKQDIERLVLFNSQLKRTGDRVSNDALSAKLRLRLNAALPPAALAKKRSGRGRGGSFRAGHSRRLYRAPRRSFA